LSNLNFMATDIGCESEAGVDDRIGSEWNPFMYQFSDIDAIDKSVAVDLIDCQRKNSKNLNVK